jgi:cyclopropane fatty-acyl-phospholipid synthase-like methyltransferase
MGIDEMLVSQVEMIEAVPASHYPEFVSACDRALKPGGRVVMQVINALSFNNVVARKRNPDPLGTFVTTHIFPGQQIPNMEFLHEVAH